MKLNFNPLYFNTLVPSESDAGNLKKLNSNYLFSDIIKIYSEENTDVSLQEIELKSFSSEGLFAKIEDLAAQQNSEETDKKNAEQNPSNLAVLSIINNLVQAITNHPDVNLADVQTFPIEKISEKVLEDGSLILNLKINDQEIKVHLEKENIEVDHLNFETKVALYNALRTLEELGESETSVSNNPLKVDSNKSQLDLFAPDEKVNLLFEEVVNQATAKESVINDSKIELDLSDKNIAIYDIENSEDFTDYDIENSEDFTDYDIENSEDFANYDIENSEELSNFDIKKEYTNSFPLNAESKNIAAELDSEYEVSEELDSLPAINRQSYNNSFDFEKADAAEVKIEINNFLKKNNIEIEKDPEQLKKNLLLTVKQLNELENIGIKIKNIEFISNNEKISPVLEQTANNDLFADSSALKNTMSFVVNKENMISSINQKPETVIDEKSELVIDNSIKIENVITNSSKAEASNSNFNNIIIHESEVEEVVTQVDINEENNTNSNNEHVVNNEIKRPEVKFGNVNKNSFEEASIKDEIPKEIHNNKTFTEPGKIIENLRPENIIAENNILTNKPKSKESDGKVKENSSNAKVKVVAENENEKDKQVVLNTNNKPEVIDKEKSFLIKNNDEEKTSPAEFTQNELTPKSESKDNSLNEVVISQSSEEPLKSISLKNESENVRPVEQAFSKINNEIKSSPVIHSKIPSEEIFVNSNEIIPELSKILSDGDKKSLSINLLPEELGKIKVVVETTKNSVEAKIEVQNEAAKTLIQNNIEALKSSLSQAGMQLNNLSISVAYQEQKNQKFSEPRKKNAYKNSNEGSHVKVSTNEGKVKSLGYNTYEYTV